MKSTPQFRHCSLQGLDDHDALSLYFARGGGTAFAPSQFGDGPVLTASYAM